MKTSPFEIDVYIEKNVSFIVHTRTVIAKILKFVFW